jgi:hypothetical protein
MSAEVHQMAFRRRLRGLAAAVVVLALLASCGPSMPTPSAATQSGGPVTPSLVPPTGAPTAAPTLPATPGSTAGDVATPTPTAAPPPTPSPSPPQGGTADTTGGTLRYQEGTWLRVLGATDDIGGTSLAALGDGSYAVAVGFKPGSQEDFGLTRFTADGQVTRSRSYTSTRDHSGSLVGVAGARPQWVKAIELGGARLSLAFDNVWVPDAGDEATLAGWQVALAQGATAGISLTDLVHASDGTYLRAVVGTAAETHLAIARVTADGVVEWAAEYPDVREPLGVFYSYAGARQGGRLFLTPDGHLLTGGYLRDAHGQERAIVLWLNQDGSVARSVTVEMDPYRLHPSAPLAHSSKYQDLALLPDGDVVLVQDFDVCSIACHDGGALITRLSSEGAQRWTVGLHALDNIGGVTFVSEVRAQGDGLILVGGSTAFESPSDTLAHLNVMMARLDGSGQPVWVRSLGTRKVSNSSNEFKTDYASALLPVGDDRMLVTGASSSFGSHQNYDGAPYVEHFDLVLGMVGLGNGGIEGASQLLWSPDIGNKYEVWAESKAVTLGTCDGCRAQTLAGVSLRPVTFAATDLALAARDLDGGVPENMRGLRFTYGRGGRDVVSSRSFLAEDESVATDPDADGIDQAWENFALEQVKPIIELDEQESWLDNRDQQFVALLTRVSPYPSRGTPTFIVFAYVVAWSKDYGGAGGIEEHRGDDELVTLVYRVKSERSLRLDWVYTSAHGGINSHAGVWNADDPTCNRAYIADSGYLSLGTSKTVGTELMCASLTMSKNRVKVQASQDKHALYPNKDICENHATLVAVLGGSVYGEDCGGGGDSLFDAYNIGEPETVPLVDNLGNSTGWAGLTESQVAALVKLFPNERVVAGNVDKPGQFCGGLNPPPDKCAGTTIASKMRLPPGDPLQAKLGPTKYRVRIDTSGDTFAGTDAAVYITLHGSDGTSFRQELDGSFERGSIDVFRFGDPATSVGDIARIGLERNDDESNPDFHLNELYGYVNLSTWNPTPDWKVKSVQIQDLVTGHAWTFTINRDLTDSAVHEFLPDPTD